MNVTRKSSKRLNIIHLISRLISTILLPTWLHTSISYIKISNYVGLEIWGPWKEEENGGEEVSHRCAANDSSLRPATGRYRVRGSGRGSALCGADCVGRMRSRAWAGGRPPANQTAEGRRRLTGVPRVGRVTVSACLLLFLSNSFLLVIH